MSRIPEYSYELEERIKTNADNLIALGVKEWMRARKKKANMTEEDQNKVVMKIDNKVREGK